MVKSGYPKLVWADFKDLVLKHYSSEPICELAEVLRRHCYLRIATVPAGKEMLSGLAREPFLIHNNLWGSKHRLFSMSAFPGLHHFILRRHNPMLGSLFQVLFLNDQTTPFELSQTFPHALIAQLVETKALMQGNGISQFTLSFVPFRDLLLIRDPFHVYIGDPSRGHEERRVWLGSDSVFFANFLHEFLSTRRFRKALEIGVGTGIQLLTAANHVDRAIGIDINPRAVAFSRLNAQINGVRNVEFIQSDLFKNLHGKFDLILANPWYCDLKSGGLEEIPGILDGLDDHLSEDGLLIMLTSSYLKHGRDTVLERLREFVRERGDYDLEADVVGYNIHPALYHEYKKHGISCSLDYVVILRKGGTGRIQRREAPLFRRWRDLSYIRAAKTLASLRP